MVTALYEDGQAVQLGCTPVEEKKLLGNIYVGRVANIVKNIQAAFVEIEGGTACFLPLPDVRNPIFCSSLHEGPLKVGDELLVQVCKEGVKTKAPVVSTNLNLPGKYAVLTTGNRQAGVSNKIPEERKVQLKSFVKSYLSGDFGFVIRTNAKNASEEEISRDLESLEGRYRELVMTAPHRPCFSLIHRAPEDYLVRLRDTYMENLQEILTDDEELYQSVFDYLSQCQPEDLPKLTRYSDERLSLVNLYSLRTAVSEALKERVWLKSGGYLVIQPTEALTVIDVNSGKYAGRKGLRETFLKINLEAAQEIARQLRLRNLSGIVVVDFIDMEASEDNQELMNAFGEYLKWDPIKTTLIGMSPLHLVELTRKKVQKPLREQLSTPCPVCHGAGVLY